MSLALSFGPQALLLHFEEVQAEQEQVEQALPFYSHLCLGSHPQRPWDEPLCLPQAVHPYVALLPCGLLL